MKAICYANLNSFNSPENITDEQMKAFFTAYITNTETEIVDIIIDRYLPDIFFAHRDGWRKIAELCRQEKIDLIIIPTVRMLATPLFDVFQANYDIKKMYGCEVRYLYENLCSIDENYDRQLQFFTCAEDELKKRNWRKNRLRSVFAEVTGITDESTAISVTIDAPQYRKIEEFARPYGANVDRIIKWFFDAIIEPKSYEKLDELLGFDNI